MNQLKGDYLAAFKQAELYSMVDSIDYDKQNEMLLELLDLLLEAQSNGKPVEKIIGSDIEKFCKSFFSGRSVIGKLKPFLDALYYYSWLVFCFQIIEVTSHFEADKGNPLMQPVDITGYLIGLSVLIMLSTLPSIVLKPFLFRWHKLNVALLLAMSLIATIGLCSGLTIWIGDRSLLIPSYLSILIPGLYILSYIMIRAINNYRDHRSIRRQKDPGETTFWRTVGEKVQRELPTELLKRYEKINKKRSRRGKPLMTPEEYTEKLYKDIKLSNYISVPLIGLLFLILLYNIINIFVHDGFTESLLFIVIVAICEIPAFAIFRSSFLGNKQKTELLAECDKRGVTLPEYAASLNRDAEPSQEAAEEDPDA